MIYLDHNASSPVRPAVREAMLPWLGEQGGSPSSIHASGRLARQAVESARRTLAEFLKVHATQVVFTSGGTEANNSVLSGLAAGKNYQGDIIVSAIEHPSILEPCQSLARRGMNIMIAPVDARGVVDAEWILSALKPETCLVSVMLANNETGVIQPIETIGQGCRARGIPLHVDAIQAVGKIPVDLSRLSVDFLSVSAHKLGGPKGVGALIVDKRFLLEPLLQGGGQEWGRRSGTENVPGIVGFGAAVAASGSSLDEESNRLVQLRTLLEESVLAEIPDCVIFGRHMPRLPNTTLLGLAGMEGETLVMNMDLAGFAVSSGSACASGKVAFSHVLRAMGVAESLGRGALRVTLGWNNKAEDVERFSANFIRVVKRLQNMSGTLTTAGG
ncbi:MAG: cysteine desulfurase [Magnetococcales bacterium]|nr:cysteine desulfurase [Magnetococcales bacterium]